MSEDVRPALTWRPILGYEGLYDASDMGDVRRRAGWDSLGRPRRERILRPSLNHSGYLIVTLSRNDDQQTHTVHRAVALAWLGPRPVFAVINHIDGNKQNNRPGNLEYCSSAANDRHAVRLGLKARGERHGSAKLSADAISTMRQLRADGWTYHELGERFGVHSTQASRVVRGLSWRTELNGQ